MSRYKTLVFAPPSNLKLAPDEEMQVANTLNAKLLKGERATLHGLMDMLDEPYDILWIMAHGTREGIPLEDGVLIAPELTSLIRSAGIQLTVFNTCDSYDTAYTIYQELETNFVATVRPVPDRQAYITGVLFSKQLAEGMDFYDAYEIAKPGQNSTYIFLGAKGQSIQVKPPYDRPQQSNYSNISDVGQLAALVGRLEAIVRGNPEWGTPGLVPTVNGLVTTVNAIGVKIDTLTIKVEQLESNQLFNRRLLLVLSVVCVALLIAVGVQIAMQAGPR